MAKYSDLSDQELIDLLNKDDEAAYEEIYNRYWPILYQSAYNILRDKSGCMDVLQEVFVWLWEHREHLQIINPKGYLLSAVKYKVANYIRKGKVRRALFTELEVTDLNELPFYDDSLEVRELKQIIAQFTSELPDKARQVFYLSRTEHLSNKEIAERLGISEKTVENQMTTNLKKLRLKMGRLSAWIIFFI
ncbi:RNA polymerase sigma-70 factor, ECF subfamily [Mucilaginibacter pineti]|uniref:RNA polymerase sigma-70 factor, ECF subfamily n=1 Tax=Mucilaginibacter pineti TaxID=1391627 RepID=A0A1G7P194_9SPHI|nr:RNA polymerase sigma-70 factor [Mucilaginibacter pineti]SDF80001.1 RNA polymerase sigma-70 factor, ECF subfamily [Mucilaginibacter pineti]